MTLPSSGTISASDVLSDRNLTNNFEVNLNIFRQIAARNRSEALPDKVEIRWSDFYAKFNEIVTAPATVTVSQRYNMTIVGAQPSTRASYILNGHAGTSAITVDANGNYTFVNMYQIAAGTYTYTFTFSTGHVRSATTVVTDTPKIQPTIVLTINIPTFMVGDTGVITLTATITPTSPMPTRTIIMIGHPDGNNTVPLNGGNVISVSYNYATFSAGTYTFKAFYPGDDTYLSGNSNTVQLVVVPKPVPPKPNVFLEYNGPTTLIVVPETAGQEITFKVYSDGTCAYKGTVGFSANHDGQYHNSQLDTLGYLVNGLEETSATVSSWVHKSGTITTTAQTFTMAPYCVDPGTYTVSIAFLVASSANSYNYTVAPKITFTIICKKPRAFFNADFESTILTPTSYGFDLPGWTILTQRVYLDGRSTIAGWPTPFDNTKPYGDSVLKDTYPMSRDSYETPDEYYTAYYSSDVASGSPGKQSLALENSGWLDQGGGYGVVHGPVAYNNISAELLAGDVVEFSWRALGNNDAYDVYAYLVNNKTGSILTLLNATGTSSAAATPWSKVSFTMKAGQDGFYTFVFISGSYDYTGGRYTGAILLVDDLTVNGVSNYYA
jgi:hypothetical protein